MSSPETTAEAAEEATEVEQDELREEIVEQFSTLLDGGLVEHDTLPGKDLWLRVSADAWPDTANAAKSLGFDYFSFLSAIDWMPSPFGRGMDSEVDKTLDTTSDEEAGEPAESVRLTGFAGGSTRFQLLARLHSTTRRVGVTFKADVEGDEPSIGTWTNTYAGADWHEREAWEMFGIEFVGHPGLRHIYLPGDFEGRPMRKDFPLLARMVKPWPGIVDVEDMPGTDDGDGT